MIVGNIQWRSRVGAAIVLALAYLMGAPIQAGAQTFTEFPITNTPNSQPLKIVTGPDGNLWFTEEAGNKIGKITPTGGITEFPINATPNSGPRGITGL